MSTVTKPYTFSAGSSIVAAEHNSNFDTIYSDYNGGILNVNINAAANIDYGKLNLNNSIQSSDIFGSIADSKLSQITTASKVSGTALTGLASIPSGAGVIPAANISITGLGSWVDKSASYGTQQAATDGFVTAVGLLTAGTIWELKGNTGTSAGTLVRRTCNTSPGNSQNIGISFPVKKNEYWSVTYTTTPDSISVYWIPLGT